MGTAAFLLAPAEVVLMLVVALRHCETPARLVASMRGSRVLIPSRDLAKWLRESSPVSDQPVRTFRANA
jgi:hypothetical protein